MQPVRRRPAIFLTVLAVHVVLIVLLVLSGRTIPPKKVYGTLSAFSLAASAASAPPVTVAILKTPVEAKPVKPTPAAVFAEQQGGKGDSDGEVCSPVDTVTAQLTGDPLVPEAIARVPESNRSISEAIVMWNTEWSLSAADPEAPLAEIRSRITATLEQLPPECLAMPVVGPRLIPIFAEDGKTTFLAFGSGEWSWQQLLMPDVEASPVEDNDWSWEDLFEKAKPENIY